MTQQEVLKIMESIEKVHNVISQMEYIGLNVEPGDECSVGSNLYGAIDRLVEIIAGNYNIEFEQAYKIITDYENGIGANIEALCKAKRAGIQ